MNPYRALIANDGYAATFQSMGQYRTALLEAWPSFIDLEDLADELLAPREIRRDANGHLQHPAMPSLGESVCIVEFLSAFGLECDAVAMEDDDHDAWERYTEAETIDCSFWTPSTPAGDGWVLLEIFESEDGPSALYARRKPDAPRYSRRTHMSPFAAKVTRVKRRTGELVVQLGHHAPDRMYPGAAVSLHWRDCAPASALTEDQIAVQDARYAIDGAITYGRTGTNKPPVGHWLTEYWCIGRQLARLGETSAWDNQTPLVASSADQVEDAPAHIDAMFKNRLTPYGMLVRALRIVANTTLFEMAKYMNMSSAELSSLEFGRKEVTQDHINAAARFFMRYGIETTQPLIAALQTSREWSDAALTATPPAAEGERSHG